MASAPHPRRPGDRPSPASALRELSPARRALLVALRKLDEASVDDLARGLDVTPGAVRQQLQVLAASGLVDHRDERRGPGRPRRLHRLTAAADALFPQAYGDLTTELLGYVDDEDPALVERLFARRRDARIDRTRRRLGDLSGPERVDALARILDEDGYLAEAEPLADGGWRIREHNCAILAVAGRHPQACSSEIDFLRAVLPDADVRRVSHIVSGDHACVYEVRPVPPAV
ncbi:MAG: ArsR family transcriptional regulator [Solirubrobacteraceae bacterium]|nr:ArsR family transcriptional regulator [Solirubrobacteraceae bacterium]